MPLSTHQACFSAFKLESQVLFICQLYAEQVRNMGICFQVKREAALLTGREQLCLSLCCKHQTSEVIQIATVTVLCI